MAVKLDINDRILGRVDLCDLKYITHALNQCCFCDLYLMTIIQVLAFVNDQQVLSSTCTLAQFVNQVFYNLFKFRVDQDF